VLQKLTQTNDRNTIQHHPKVVLWLLKLGETMEYNLCQIAQTDYGLEDSHFLVFAELAPMEKHWRRLALDDLFLDALLYNAHTVGCDALYAGVPIVSLLQPDATFQQSKGEDIATTTTTTKNNNAAAPPYTKTNNNNDVTTDKLPNRIGASLLKAYNMDELIAPTMTRYEELMMQSVMDPTWFSSIAKKLKGEIASNCPLFDIEQWVKNMEIGLRDMYS